MSIQINLKRVQNVHLPNACMHRNVSFVHIQRSARPSWCPSEFWNSFAQSRFFVEPGVKIKGAYYRDLLLMQKLLPVIRQISGNEFVFQQDNSSTPRETIELLHREMCRTLFHRNSGHRTVQILTRLITKSGLQCSSMSIKQRFEMLTNCDSICWTFGAALNKTSSTYPLTSGMCDSKHACVREEDILSPWCKFICIDVQTSR